MFKTLEKVEKEIQPKEKFKDEVQSNGHLRSWISKRDVVHICGARIPYQYDDKDIEQGFPFGIGTDDYLLFESLLDCSSVAFSYFSYSICFMLFLEDLCKFVSSENILIEARCP